MKRKSVTTNTSRKSKLSRIPANSNNNSNEDEDEKNNRTNHNSQNEIGKQNSGSKKRPTVSINNNNDRAVSIKNLPSDCIAHILSFVSDFNLFGSMINVCVAFRECIKETSFLSSFIYVDTLVALKFQGYSPAEILKILLDRSCTLKRALVFSDISMHASKLWVEPLMNISARGEVDLSNISHVTLSCKSISASPSGRKEVEKMKDFFRSLTGLESFTVNGAGSLWIARHMKSFLSTEDSNGNGLPPVSSSPTSSSKTEAPRSKLRSVEFNVISFERNDRLNYGAPKWVNKKVSELESGKISEIYGSIQVGEDRPYDLVEGLAPFTFNGSILRRPNIIGRKRLVVDPHKEQYISSERMQINVETLKKWLYSDQTLRRHPIERVALRVACPFEILCCDTREDQYVDQETEWVLLKQLNLKPYQCSAMSQYSSGTPEGNVVESFWSRLRSIDLGHITPSDMAALLDVLKLPNEIESISLGISKKNSRSCLESMQKLISKAPKTVKRIEIKARERIEDVINAYFARRELDDDESSDYEGSEGVPQELLAKEPLVAGEFPDFIAGDPSSLRYDFMVVNHNIESLKIETNFHFNLLVHGNSLRNLEVSFDRDILLPKREDKKEEESPRLVSSELLYGSVRTHTEGLSEAKVAVLSRIIETIDISGRVSELVVRSCACLTKGIWDTISSISGVSIISETLRRAAFVHYPADQMSHSVASELEYRMSFKKSKFEPFMKIREDAFWNFCSHYLGPSRPEYRTSRSKLYGVSPKRVLEVASDSLIEIGFIDINAFESASIRAPKVRTDFWNIDSIETTGCRNLSALRGTRAKTNMFVCDHYDTLSRFKEGRLKGHQNGSDKGNRTIRPARSWCYKKKKEADASETADPLEPQRKEMHVTNLLNLRRSHLREIKIDRPTTTQGTPREPSSVNLGYSENGYIPTLERVSISGEKITSIDVSACIGCKELSIDRSCKYLSVLDMSLRSLELSQESLLSMLSEFKSLKSLTLRHYNNNSPDPLRREFWASLASLCPLLSRVALVECESLCSIPPIFSGVFVYKCRNFSGICEPTAEEEEEDSIEELHVHECDNRELLSANFVEGGDSSERSLSSYRKLKVLEISGLSSGFSRTMVIPRKMRNLENLRVSKCEGVSCLSIDKSLKNLTELHVSDCPDLLEINQIERCGPKRKRRLSISKTRKSEETSPAASISDDQLIEQLLRTSEECYQDSQMDDSDSYDSDDSMDYDGYDCLEFPYRPLPKSLRTLSIHGCKKIGDDFFDSIQDFACGIKTLKLSCCNGLTSPNIGFRHVSHIEITECSGMVLPNIACPALTEIGLYRNKNMDITKVTIMLSHNSQRLKHLDLDLAQLNQCESCIENVKMESISKGLSYGLARLSGTNGSPTGKSAPSPNRSPGGENKKYIDVDDIYNNKHYRLVVSPNYIVPYKDTSYREEPDFQPYREEEEDEDDDDDGDEGSSDDSDENNNDSNNNDHRHNRSESENNYVPNSSYQYIPVYQNDSVVTLAYSKYSKPSFNKRGNEKFYPSCTMAVVGNNNILFAVQRDSSKSGTVSYRNPASKSSNGKRRVSVLGESNQLTLEFNEDLMLACPAPDITINNSSHPRIRLFDTGKLTSRLKIASSRLISLEMEIAPKPSKINNKEETCEDEEGDSPRGLSIDILECHRFKEIKYYINREATIQKKSIVDAMMYKMSTSTYLRNYIGSSKECIYFDSLNSVAEINLTSCNNLTCSDVNEILLVHRDLKKVGIDKCEKVRRIAPNFVRALDIRVSNCPNFIERKTRNTSEKHQN